jgi:hypothetical protein
MSYFLEALKKGSSKISRLSIHHLTGDEFTATEAKGLAQWIHHSKVRALNFQCNEFDAGTIEALTSELRSLGNRSLQEATVVTHDDEREERRIDTTALDKLLAENRTHESLLDDDFSLLMKRTKESLDNREFHDVEALCTSLLNSYKMTPVQAGWFADYRHRALFYIGTERSQREAIRLLKSPEMKYETTIRNRLWMVSTSAEMAHQLNDSQLTEEMVELYLAENQATKDQTERGQNEIRCRINALHFKSPKGTEHGRKVIEILRANPTWAEGIQLPPEIKAALT